MHPISYDTAKGTYKAAYTHVISEFCIDFDSEEFVEYRFVEDVNGNNDEFDSDDSLLNQIVNLLDNNIKKEDMLKPNILQLLKHQLECHIMKDSNCSQIYGNKIGKKCSFHSSFEEKTNENN